MNQAQACRAAKKRHESTCIEYQRSLNSTVVRHLISRRRRDAEIEGFKEAFDHEILVYAKMRELALGFDYPEVPEEPFRYLTNRTFRYSTIT